MSSFMKKVPIILQVSSVLAVIAFFLPFYIIGDESASLFEGAKELAFSGQGLMIIIDLVFVGLVVLFAFLKKPVPCIIFSAIFALAYYYDYFDLYLNGRSYVESGIGQIMLIFLPALTLVMSILLVIYKKKAANENVDATEKKPGEKMVGEEAVVVEKTDE